jgi:hypothetical protein
VAAAVVGTAALAGTAAVGVGEAALLARGPHLGRLGKKWIFFKVARAAEGSFLNYFLRLREKLAPTGKNRAYRKKSRLATVGT